MEKQPVVTVVRAFTVTPATVRRVREALAMTPEAFGRFIGVSTATVAAWESGAKRPEGTLEERAFDQVLDEAKARFPDLKIDLELNPAAARRGPNP